MGGMDVSILILKLMVAVLQLLDAVLETVPLIQVQVAPEGGGKPPPCRRPPGVPG